MTIEMEVAQIRLQIDIAYSELRSQFINISKPHLSKSDLNSLKINYSNVINSERTSDFINSIEELLRILEKRGVLSYDNIEILKYISKTYVRDKVLERTLRNYEGQSRPVLPPHNRYLTQSGKYKKNRLTEHEAIASNHSVIPSLNHTENENQIENESVNRVLEIPARNQAQSEDLTIHQTETLIQNDVQSLFKEQRHNANDRNYFVKVYHKIYTRYGVGVSAAFIGATLLIVLISMHNIPCVKSPDSAPPLRAQPGAYGLETIYNDASQLHRQPIQMTLHTTQPTFSITLPGSIDFRSPNQSTTHGESEVMRIVLQEVSEKLGKYWRNVARYLRVTEYEIDEIDCQLNLSLNEKALKAMLQFQSKCDPLQWKSKLKHALDKARRRDLIELVDELSSRKY